jgi:hypothetical protein
MKDLSVPIFIHRIQKRFHLNLDRLLFTIWSKTHSSKDCLFIIPYCCNNYLFDVDMNSFLGKILPISKIYCEEKRGILRMRCCFLLSLSDAENNKVKFSSGFRPGSKLVQFWLCNAHLGG